MKKLMLGILMIIPILVLLLVAATSTFVSSVSHIGVESIVLASDELELDLPDDTLNLNSLLLPIVSPRFASDKTVTWVVEDIEYFDQDYKTKYETAEEEAEAFRKENDTVHPGAVMLSANGSLTFDNNKKLVNENVSGKLEINCYCSFTVVAQAETQTATCVVNVGGTDVRSIRLSVDNDVECQLAVGEYADVEELFTPANTIVDETVWTSSNERVVSVDANGALTAKAEGTAYISLKVPVHSTYNVAGVTPEYKTSSTLKVNVIKSASQYGNTVWVHRAFAADEIGAENAALLDANGVLSGGKFFFADGKNEFKLNTSNGVLTVKRCLENDIVIDKAHELYSAEKEFVFGLSNVGFGLSASWRSVLKDGLPTVEWSVASSPDGAVSVNSNGMLAINANGTAKVSAQTNVGGVEFEDSFDLVAHETVATLALKTTNSSFKVGIAKETVFAAQKLDGGNEVANGVDIIISKPSVPSGRSTADYYADYLFSVDDTDKAYFVGNRLMFVAENITEMTVLTVTVQAKYPKYTHALQYTTRTLDVKVVSGLECATFADVERAAAEEKNICLVADVQADKQMVRLGSDIYANNHIVSMTSEAVKWADNGRGIFCIYKSNTVSNGTFCCKRLEENEKIESTQDAQDAGLRGTVLYYEMDWNETKTYEDRLTCNLEYSIVENASLDVRYSDTDLYVNGCIMRNTTEIAFYCPTYTNRWTDANGVEQEFSRYCNLHLNNVIMSNLCSTCGNFDYRESFFKRDDKGEYLKGEDGDWVYDKEHNSSLVQTGFLDVYNWQNIYNMNMITTGHQEYDDILQMALSDVFALPAFDHLRITQGEGTTGMYMHLGFLSSGLIYPTAIQTSFEDKRFVEFDSSKFSYKGSQLEAIVTPIMTTYPVKMYIYDNTSSIRPDSTYTVNRALVNRLNPDK